MDNKMLFDATHPEETRVVVVRGNRVEEFDFEAENKKQLKGNIYLAKVTRVEPSLQAAFVDYGGNRHGFLAFSEIHPDYYQIPVADRQALLEEEAAAHKADDGDDEFSEKPKRRARHKKTASKAASASKGDRVQSDIVDASDDLSQATENADDQEREEATDEVVEIGADAADAAVLDNRADRDEDDETDEEDSVESVGSEDAMEEVPERHARPRGKQYKIQEVIKRRQIILVQVVKEERGNKGAALTTYLSLAGRYSVLMPNTDRGGGISRKITNQTDRKRLRTIANDLDVPEGMGVILRTAGAARTKTEIRRDFEYLMRLWENVRDLTLKSSAPMLVYEEGSLLKRSIRDLYNKDIDQILVAGEQGYREAKDFMRMLMPSHAKNVQPYKEPQPIFARFGVETQLDAMFSPHVTLKSGGYLVINQTEALVSIDVNSGRSTRENSIEDTALSTNLETAEEVARQLRLRDLAGLIVIDFIDMDDKRNIRAVERRLKECLRNDRARIQVGRISHFGLLEMSRQRIRAGVLESTMEPCKHCEGTGAVRAPASVALYVLRAIEDYLNKGSKYDIIVRTKSAVALYILNFKRAHLIELEGRYGLSIRIDADETITGEYCTIIRGEKAESPRTLAMVTSGTTNMDAELARDAELDAAAEAEEQQQIASDEEAGDTSQSRKRRRRRRRNGNDEIEAGTDTDETSDAASVAEAREDNEEAAPKKKRRRRGRRGGRRERERNDEIQAVEKSESEAVTQNIAVGDENVDDQTGEPPQPPAPAPDAPSMPELDVSPAATNEEEAEKPEKTKKPVAKKRTRTRKKPAETDIAATQSSEPSEAIAARAESDAKAVVSEEKEMAASAAVSTAEAPEPIAANTSEPAQPEDEQPKPRKGGWWQRRSFF